MLICGASLVFAKQKLNFIHTNQVISLEKTQITKTYTVKKLNNKNFAPCTVTVTTYWYNEYGVYLGSTSNTVTYNGSSNTSWNCAMAELLAE